MWVCVCTYACIGIHKYIYIYVRVYECTYIYVCMFVVLCKVVMLCVLTHACAHVSNLISKDKSIHVDKLIHTNKCVCFCLKEETLTPELEQTLLPMQGYAYLLKIPMNPCSTLMRRNIKRNLSLCKRALNVQSIPKSVIPQYNFLQLCNKKISLSVKSNTHLDDLDTLSARISKELS